jgi:hypothetical protein
MKKYLILIVLILSSTIWSCKDIINSDPNRVEIIDSTSLSWKDYIEYRFLNDNVNYLNNDSTKIWSVQRPSAFGKPFIMVNNFKDSIIIVNNIKLRNGSIFYINHNQKFPLILKPNEVNSNIQFLVLLNSQNLSNGIYSDKIIINDDENTGFYIRVLIY